LKLNWDYYLGILGQGRHQLQLQSC
jgi:hypothetical protein